MILKVKKNKNLDSKILKKKFKNNSLGMSNKL